MDNTYGEFQGTDLDPSLDFDFDDEEENDLLPILGLAAVFASIVGGILVLVGRRREPSATERVQEALETASSVGGKNGKKALKAATQAAGDLKLRELLDDAIGKAKDASSNGDIRGAVKEARKRASKAADSAQLSDLLKHAQEKASEASKRGAKMASSVDAGEAASSAKDKATEALAGLGLAKILQDAMEKASGAAKSADLAGTASEARKRAGDVLSDVDTDRAGQFLDALKEKIGEAIDQLRTEVAPRAVDTVSTNVVPAAQSVAQRVREDVLPAAQDAVERLRSDVIPAAQERAGKLADEYEVSSRARKAAEAAKSGAGSFSELMKDLGMAVAAKVVEEIFPEAKNLGSKAAKKAREDVIPAAADTAGQAATRVKEDVLPKVGEVASQTPGMLSDLLEMAREKVGEALEKSEPVASEAAKAASKGAEKASRRAKELAKATAKASKGKSQGVGGAVSGAVGGAVGATTYVTRETTGILFWLAALGAVILLVFVPDRDKQEEIWNNIRQFLGEVREMWRDLQGPEYDELDTGSESETV